MSGGAGAPSNRAGGATVSPGAGAPSSPAAGAAIQPFDSAANAYDVNFSHRLLGRWLREAVWEHLDAAFAPGDHVLDLGCGTGEDAIHLAGRGVNVVATDPSSGMLAAAAEKVRTAGLDGRVRFVRSHLASAAGIGRLDGAFANFGAWNCVEDRSALAEALATRLAPGSRLVLVVMGPFCLWEIGWNVMRGRLPTALRRLRGGRPAHVGGGATIPVWYPSPRRLRAELRPWFRHEKTVAVGLLLPPTELAPLVERRRSIFSRLRAVERRVAPRFPAPWLSDHYLAVFERR